MCNGQIAFDRYNNCAPYACSHREIRNAEADVHKKTVEMLKVDLTNNLAFSSLIFLHNIYCITVVF